MVRGIFVGLLSWVMMAATYLGMWTAFDLPAVIWIAWAGDYLLSAVIAGAAMGWVIERFEGVVGSKC
ncbi:MAG: hypothetical protein M2R45_04456 [Verrucomicrobia subdivision 3 bacterium]|nr:hypothetical protein [Limisphaerales bacterium]MCS1415013.1 hypothetical protein [Limisphaerales bacterium]